MTISNRLRDLAAFLICLAFCLAGAALFFKYIFGILIPFLIAWALALAVRPIAVRIGARTRIPERLLRLTVLILLFVMLCLAVWFGGGRLLRELQRLLAGLTDEDTVARIGDTLRALLSRLPFSASAIERYAEDILDRSLSALVSVLPGIVGRLASSVPRALIAAVITLIAAVYFSLDLETIHRALRALCPARWQGYLTRAGNGALRMAGTYARAYLILMLLMGVILFVGFLILGVEYALLLAFIVALVDLFPVLGVGTVLVPWSAFCFLTGDVPRAVGLLILWGVALLVRQFAEPRILGGSLGVHPLPTLLFMYAGLSLGGLAGMLLAPLLAVPVVALLRRNDAPEETPVSAPPAQKDAAE